MVRTFIIPEDRNILIRVPEDYIGKQVEVIAFTLEENSNVTQVKKQASFTASQASVGVLHQRQHGLYNELLKQFVQYFLRSFG